MKKTRKYKDYIRAIINTSKEFGFVPVVYYPIDSQFARWFGINKRAKYRLILKHKEINKKISFTIDFLRYKETDSRYTNKNYWEVDIIDENFLVRPFGLGAAADFYDILKFNFDENGLRDIKLWFEKLDCKLKKRPYLLFDDEN